ncbi:hypothetical protein PYK79_11045 [Streptomyces sp. ID05-04B]|uniref:hypothetical protein n=1 Tax=Streptomyces sp. ID05-04B TaxID=3028661 RepID=UPI0029C28EDD|nr:hypothetical protein [Streptomyces sp. ID05-04B]MDX5563790.1 hypothetical protein [Streptomyces sp. ID05-04B]
MPPNLPAVGLPRSAAASNAAIRAIAIGAQGRRWTRAEVALYRLLVEEWVTAEGHVTEAA